jgi:hypothetical protein
VFSGFLKTPMHGSRNLHETLSHTKPIKFLQFCCATPSASVIGVEPIPFSFGSLAKISEIFLGWYDLLQMSDCPALRCSLTKKSTPLRCSENSHFR